MASPQTYLSVSRRPPDVEDYIDMLRRYRSWIIGPMFAGLVLAVVVAFMWPDTYISQAVMRITPQQVPENLIPSMVSTQMAERLNQMQQEILSRTSLQELIQRPSLDLYKKERQRLPLEDIVQDMRNRYIRIQMMDTPGGGGQRFASAFLIQFSYTDRYKAQAVVRELVTKFTEQNVTVQRNQATLTTSFLNDELKSAQDNLNSLDARILKFKNENQGRLPEQLPANIQALQGLRMELNQFNEAINRNNQEKMFSETTLQSLKNQANFISNNLDDTVTSQTVAVKNERLIRLNQAIQEARSTLAGLKQSFTDDYPDIKTFQARLAALEKERDDLEKLEIEQAANAPPSEPTQRKVTNPQMQKSLQDVQAQIAAVSVRIQAANMDVEERIRQKAEVEKQIVAIQSRIEMSPPLEQQYASLLRDYELAKQNYSDMARRRGASETAQNLEEHKAGQNLEVLDPASLPEAPSEPNRLAIAAVGSVLGLVAGIVLAGAREVKNTSLKNLKDVRAYTNLPVLSSIPLLENALLVRRKRRLFWLAWSSAAIIGSIAMSGSAYYYYFGHT
jgi:polysaccharide chain length determinant protein (PEP-CTERM system associated)